MKSSLLVRLLLLSAFLFNTILGSEIIPDRILVKYRADTTTALRTSVEEKHRLTLLQEIKLFKIFVYTFDSDAITSVNLCEKIKLEPVVETAEPDQIRKISSVNDPDFPKQWYLNNTGQTANGKSGPTGIDIRWPSAFARYNPQSTIKVAVVDSGLAILHPDIVTSAYSKDSEPVNGIDDDGNGLIDDWCGYDVYSSDSLPLDQNGHGTLVSGIIAASINNYKGGAGITNNVDIIPYRVFDQFGRGGEPKFNYAGAGVSDILAAVALAVNEGSKIINLSLTGGGYSSLEQDAYNQLAQRNILAVIAAGNGGADLKGDNNDVNPIYPASYTSSAIISVAAQKRDGGLASFSNYGLLSVDIAAPGTDIYGPDVNRKTIFNETFDYGAPGWVVGRNYGDQSYLNWTLSYLGTDGFLTDQNAYTTYLPNTNTWARSPYINLTNTAGARLEFDAYFGLADDYVILEVSSDGINWFAYEYFYDEDISGSSSASIDISDLDGQSGYLRFRLVSDYSYQGIGVVIDNILITGIDDFNASNPKYQFSDGTSFAAPIVTGVAAMVWTQRPDLTAAQVRNCILQSSRPIALLNGKVATGGMVDANAALIYADSLPKTTQTLYFNSIPNIIYNPSGANQVLLQATSSVGLPITYEVISGPATINNNTLTITGLGAITVRASNAGTNSYSSAYVIQSFTASLKQQQTISFAQPADKAYGDAPFLITSSASSSLPTSISLVSGPATLAGNTLTITGAGQIILRATQSGNSTYESASPVERTINVYKKIAGIGTAGLSKTYDGSRHTITAATSPSGLSLSISYDGATLGPIDAGTYQVNLSVIDPNYTGNSTATLTITKATQSILPPNIAAQVNFSPSANVITLNATATSGLPVSYSVLSGPATVSGNTLTLTGSGYVTLRSTQVGNNNYLSAPNADINFNANNLSDVPQIVNQPTNVLAAVNATQVFNVTTLGTGLTYQWFFAGKAIKGATSEDLTLKVTSKSAGTYTLRITDNTGDTAQALVTLRVAVVPKITAQPAKAVSLAVGGSTTLSVSATGEALSYQWFRNGVALDGKTASTLSLTNATSDTSGNYTVRVSNIAGSATTKGTALTVLAPPTVGTITGPSTVQTGKAFTLGVTASGPGKLTYQWRLNGSAISKATKSTYAVKGATSANAGTYTVTVTNSVGATTSVPRVLEVTP
jgi:hypothetical protein